MSAETGELASVPALAGRLPGLEPGTSGLYVSGASMEPTLLEGDLLHVVAPVDRTRFGDLLLLRHGRILYVHRHVGRTRGGLRTKGDGRGHLDGWLTAPVDVLGRAVRISRAGRTLPLDSRAGNLVRGLWSALCGQLYRVAIRLDGALAGESGREYRADIERLNAAGFWLLSRLG